MTINLDTDDRDVDTSSNSKNLSNQELTFENITDKLKKNAFENDYYD